MSDNESRVRWLEAVVQQQQQRLHTLETLVEQQARSLTRLEAIVRTSSAGGGTAAMAPQCSATAELALSDSMRQLTSQIEQQLRASDAVASAVTRVQKLNRPSGGGMPNRLMRMPPGGGGAEQGGAGGRKQGESSENSSSVAGVHSVLFGGSASAATLLPAAAPLRPPSR